MEREQLEEIRARAEAATEGPWFTGGAGRWPSLKPHELIVSPKYPLMEFEDTEQGRADAKFVAAARSDVPALLDEIDRLNAVAWKLRTVMIQQHEAGSHFLWIDDCPACVKARDECDGDYSCDEQKAWQREYEDALSLPMAPQPLAEGGTSKGSEVTP